jgi:hypothetical protein
MQNCIPACETDISIIFIDRESCALTNWHILHLIGPRTHFCDLLAPRCLANAVQGGIVLTLISQESPEGHLLLILLFWSCASHWLVNLQDLSAFATTIIVLQEVVELLKEQAYPCLRLFQDSAREP